MNAEATRPIRVCFVCLGNICRSPTAEAVMRHLLLQEERQEAVPKGGARRPIEVTSAGTGDWHVGEPRDRRSSEVGARRGIPLSGRAYQFTARDFERCDYVVAMDRRNSAALEAMATKAADRAKISLLRSFAASGGSRGGGAGETDLDVPDPYYGAADGFDEVFDICLASCAALLRHIRQCEAGDGDDNAREGRSRRAP